eukprot:15456639-Alexandrium_andersonii.AAC.1
MAVSGRSASSLSARGACRPPALGAAWELATICSFEYVQLRNSLNAAGCSGQDLSLIHISEPTRLALI